MMIDPDLFAMSAYSIQEVVLAVFGLVGSADALFAFLIFTVWGIAQIVNFFRKIIG